jgi:NMD protein affecting ribosome stability and mRNA decay
VKSSPVPPGFKRVRRDRVIQEVVHDLYRSRSKPAEPTACPDCGAIFDGGRWRRLPTPAHAHRQRCPACQRIHDRYPAGYVTLNGEFLAGHLEEVTHLMRHVESRESAEHPLQRIIDISPENGGLLVTTTDPHLARALGEAVHRAYRGKLEYHYNREQDLLRVHWAR